MQNRFGLCLSLALLTGLSGCASLGLGLGAPSVPLPEGALALGDGLVGQIKDVHLRGDARRKAIEAEFQALQFSPAGREIAWSEGRWHGQVMPTQLYRIGSQDCRGFTHTLLDGAKSWKQLGTACRGEDGNWRIVV
ncbi:hypothetical protein GCM10011390_10120 [Aureimonas endophytica]|uniref:Surface antigen n=1 Tax=Aureimonas endophytica TaxID=2027858 RepID=A0A917E1R1_9HYPH|nr:hypothetical protein [Aureimonas endophytica]GGD93322.1 hypothetical protein GCM10011390_10120 [Aureimonas endophytica]